MSLEGFGPLLLEGLKVTVLLALCSFSIGLLIGILGAFAKLSPFALLRGLAQIYTTVIRGTPELLIIFLIFFGGQIVLTKLLGRFVEVDPFISGVVALSTVFGGYCTEVFRAAFQSIPKGLNESGRSLGMSSWTLFRRIQWPLMLRFSLPALGNLWLVMLKETALVSVIGLNDIMRNAHIAVSNTKEPFTFFLVAAFMYLGLTMISSFVIKGVDQKFFPKEAF